MNKKISENLNLETEIPIMNVSGFKYVWKLNSHAVVCMEGYIDRGATWNRSQVYDSKMRLWLDEDEQCIFSGDVIDLKTKEEGGLESFSLKIISASCRLDRKISSRSFQNIKKTYGEILREAVIADGGQMIRNRESDQEIKIPVFCYQETSWQFAMRLAARTGTFLIPDVITGRPNLWFGMRKGKEVSISSEEEYTYTMVPLGKGMGFRYEIESNLFYSIGDIVTFANKKLIITEIEGCFEHGELVFKYILEDMKTEHRVEPGHSQNAGLGLMGTIHEVKGEMIKIGLDIDSGESTGEYFYPWQPETGNSLYTMPEPGARALLYFYDAEQKYGTIIHCLGKDAKSKNHYKNRSMDLTDGNHMYLWRDEIVLSKGERYKLTVGDSTISAQTKRKVKISAGGSIFIKGNKITIKTPEEVNISQA